VGFPIRIFLDQSSFAAPQNFSQRTTSFIASQCQGIHRMPLRRLIALIVDTHQILAKPIFAEPPPSRSVSLFSKRKWREDRALAVPSRCVSNAPQMNPTRKTFLLHTIRSTSAGLKAADVLQDPMSVLCMGSEPLDHSCELPNHSPPGNNRIVPLHNVKQPRNKPSLRISPLQTFISRTRSIP